MSIRIFLVSNGALCEEYYGGDHKTVADAFMKTHLVSECTVSEHGTVRASDNGRYLATVSAGPIRESTKC